MTTIDLLKTLKAFVEKSTRDSLLTAPQRNEDGEYILRRPAVFLMDIPEKEQELKAAPWIVIQAINGADKIKDGRKDEDNVEYVRIVALTFSENAETAALDGLELLERIRIDLRKAGTLAAMYGIGDIETLTYTNIDRPYYAAEMTVIFYMPRVTTEVTY